MPNSRSRRGIVLGMLLGTALGGAALATARAEDAPHARGDIPSSNHVTIATPGSRWFGVSRPLTADDLRGRFILLDFFAFGDVEGIAAIPELAKLEKEFGADLSVIGVHSPKFDAEKDPERLRQAIGRDGIDFPVVHDRDFRIWRSFEVRARPTFVLLLPNGDLAATFVGVGHFAQIAAQLRESLRAPRSRAAQRPPPLPLARELAPSGTGEFLFPSQLSFDAATKTLFVADAGHRQIAAYAWDPREPARLKPLFRVGNARGESGFAEGGYASARFALPEGLAAGKGVLYVADAGNHAIRKIDLLAKTVTTIAGTGALGEPKIGKNLPAKRTALASPRDLALYPDDGHLAIAMAGSHQLWSLDTRAGLLSVIAGSGSSGTADGLLLENSLSEPSGLSESLGNLYFVDAGSSALRFYFEGFVKTLVGGGAFDFGFRDGARADAKMQHPLGVYADIGGIYVADADNHSVRRFDLSRRTLETVIGDGQAGEGAATAPADGRQARLNSPSAIAKLADGIFVIADSGNHRLVLWTRANGKTERMAILGEKRAAATEAPEEGGVASVPGPGVASIPGPGVASISGPGVAPRRRLAVRLPNLLEMPEAVVDRTNPEIRVSLPERYALDPAGESFARIFAGASPREKLLREWSGAEVALSFRPTGLRAGAAYVFQGTFYFCLDTKRAVCDRASVSFPIRVDPSGSERIDVPLRASAGK